MTRKELLSSQRFWQDSSFYLRKLNQARVLRRMPDALSGFDEVFGSGEHDVWDVSLRVAVVKREPSGLDLHHDPVPRQEHVAHIGQPESVGQDLPRLDRLRVCRVQPVTATEDVGREHLLIAAEFRVVGNFIGPDVDDLYHPIGVASGGGCKQAGNWLAGNPERLFERFGLIDQNVRTGSGMALVINEPFTPRRVPDNVGR